ncbi:MAG: YbhB/YbcL family Raf kinase inhibitor-like protein [Ligilactobacillus animalis]|uniref:YbhB/YbcL family Raf kinase inhibitor-like protein n=1 Tax=Ligilactobacillus animalis TaxID=1605 RepID=UPI002432308C|nr:YbhB/YbcL family Raf kinase inhibitor-like protein [Ligilactobacillus animalis]MCI5942739.1 YbhB/YbcL family Raf kinase inhibitor-like protein [Ligilactobacillus animalis]MDY2993961.1 YbhB/YbcL family Raf kinase inhibitor-like protein [Ligilactobacillus animalis]
MKIKVNFKNYTIPAEYAKGASMQDTLLGNPIRSFPFQICEIPANTKYLAFSLIDHDAVPVCGFSWVHWVVANIPTSHKQLINIPENFSRTDHKHLSGKNSFSTPFLETDFSLIENNYVGPTPPDSDHQYLLKVYALKDKLDLKDHFYFNDFLEQVNLAELASCELKLIGKY